VTVAGQHALPKLDRGLKLRCATCIQNTRRRHLFEARGTAGHAPRRQTKRVYTTGICVT
jgi:hypothetical protein